jgi:hypothetical protein
MIALTWQLIVTSLVFQLGAEFLIWNLEDHAVRKFVYGSEWDGCYSRSKCEI